MHPETFDALINLLASLPGMNSESARTDLLTSVFVGCTQRADVNCAGGPREAARRMTFALDAFGLLPNGQLALVRLLAVIRLDLGTDKHALLERISHALQAAPDQPLFTSPRERELQYLDQLREQGVSENGTYTPLSGESLVRDETQRPRRAKPMIERPEMKHTPWSRDLQQPREPRRFTDAISEMLRIRRLVLLGEPGAGKTTTLWKLADHLIEQARNDPRTPIPLLVRLGNWTAAQQPLLDFIGQQAALLKDDLPTLLTEQRAALLLDGLNEMPVDQREAKSQWVKALIAAHPNLIAVITCREQDYGLDLDFDRVTIEPLKPTQIREFVARYLGQERGEALFWRLAGQAAQQTESQFQNRFAQKLPDWQRVFWDESQLPDGLRWGYKFSNKDQEGNELWQGWLGKREQPASLLQLARNPYMLGMLIDVSDYNQGNLPANRGQLFADFVGVLIAREQETHVISDLNEPAALRSQLARLAYTMQTRRNATGEVTNQAGALTTLPLEDARTLMGERLLYLGGSTSVLALGDEVRFSHQLLQEYFAAHYMQTEIENERLQAEDIWKPATWWERTNWEEATILLAGLYTDDCTLVLDWVAAANPEVAAQCITRSGAHTPDETKLRLRAQWLPRLTDLQRDPNPQARANVGRALGSIKLSDGSPLDNRPGVGIIIQKGVAIPDIAWVAIPAGEFVYGEREDGAGIVDKVVKRLTTGPKRITLPAFKIAAYPVTYAQFQAFVDASDGFANPRWWEGLAEAEDNRRTPAEQAFAFWNHPRENISWYDAVAFCRWLSDKLGYTVRLPTEQEWERAARGTQRREYAYGDDYDPNKANTELDIRQTSAVGMYPNGTTPEGAHDLTGNVLEWCLNEYDKPKRTQLAGDATRVLRGGSWYFTLYFARAAYCVRNHPGLRGYYIGFRFAAAPVPLLCARFTLRSAL